MAQPKFVSCIFAVSLLAGHLLETRSSSTNFELLRTRVYRMEKRIGEEIDLLRRELFAEIQLINDDNDDSTDSPLIQPGSAINASLHEHLRGFKESLLTTVRQLQLAFQTEKREVRSVNEKVDCLTDIVNDAFPNGLQLMKASLEKLIDIEKLLKPNGSHKLIKCDSTVDCMGTKDTQNAKRYSDCFELLLDGHKTNGIYTVHPDNVWRPLEVFCDMTTSGGGWTVFQRRQDGSENFERLWLDYAFGFGDLNGEFWLGNEFIHRLTSRSPHELRIELEDFDNDSRVAEYGLFSVGPANDLYRLDVEFAHSDVSESLVAYHHDRQFSTKDKGPSSYCSKAYKGGFWYDDCHAVNVNGLYLKGNHSSYADGVNWSSFRGHHYSLKKTEMKFRPK